MARGSTAARHCLTQCGGHAMISSEFPLLLQRSALLSQFPNIGVGMSTRQGEHPDAPFAYNLGYALGDDDTRVTGNIARYAEALGLLPEELAVMRQVHGDTIRDVGEPGLYPDCDALVTSQPRVGITVRTADCAPVMLYATDQQVIAAVHAGWRGTAAHVTAKTVAHLCDTYRVDPANIFAWIGPAARACCYDVGSEVAALFPEEYLTRHDTGVRLDVQGLNAHQLIEAGVPADNIEIEGLCTIHERTLFHSWRRDAQRSGRMLSTIYLRDEIS